MADGLGSDDTEMEDMIRVESGRRGSTSRPDSGGRSQGAMSPMSRGSLTDDEMNVVPGANEQGNSTFQVEPHDENSTETETLIPLAGINDDGYFGDASGQWMRLEPRAEIVFETRAADEKTFTEEVLDFCNSYGASFIGGLLTIVVLITVLIVWATHLEQQGGQSSTGEVRRALRGL